MERPLDFEWDAAKAKANLEKHGIAFEIAALLFTDPERADFDASHPTDGEVRRKAVGLIDGRLITVVYTLRGAAIRLISARRANASETRAHDNG